MFQPIGAVLFATLLVLGLGCAAEEAAPPAEPAPTAEPAATEPAATDDAAMSDEAAGEEGMGEEEEEHGEGHPDA